MTDDEVERERLKLLTAHFITHGAQICGSAPYSGLCLSCAEKKDDIAKRRLNTAYPDDASNWMLSCGECFEEARAYYAERWTDYYNEVL